MRDPLGAGTGGQVCGARHIQWTLGQRHIPVEARDNPYTCSRGIMCDEGGIRHGGQEPYVTLDPNITLDPNVTPEL